MASFGLARWAARYVVVPVVLIITAILAPLVSSETVEAKLTVEDYAIIGEALHATGMDEWERAFRLMDAVDDPLAAKLFRWLALLNQEADADFSDLAGFVIDNPTWPRIDDLQTLAEDRLTDSADKTMTLKLFKEREPLTTRGRVRHAEALIGVNEIDEAVRQIKQAWMTGDFSKSEERAFFRRHRGHLNADDHGKRLDHLLWDRRWRPSERMLPNVSKDRQKLAKARLALQQRSRGVDVAVKAVPDYLAADPGLLFDRIRWRRQKKKHDLAIELLLDPPDRLVRPERWWYERSFQIRRKIEERDFETAYRLASQHGQLKGGDYAEAEWLSGWLALRFLDRPKSAFRHFVRLYDRVVAPVRQARAGYWAGRAAASQGDHAGATAWYRRAAAHQSAYHGQLAALELDDEVIVAAPAEPTISERVTFEVTELARIARMLIAAGTTSHLDVFLQELSAQAETAAEIGMIGEFAIAAGQPALLAQVGRTAAFHGKVNEFAAFPIPKIEGLLRPAASSVEAPLLLGLARQESMFRTTAASQAGARGLLQVLPSTANIVARSIGEDYDPDRLAGDPNYNALLGGHYLQSMLERFDGEAALALGAYNAGPLRINRWLKLHGDPRTGDPHDVIDWIELIPFSETRNYVQRVLEGYRVYRRRLAEDDVVLIDYPGINALHPPPVPMRRPSDLTTRAASLAAEPTTSTDIHRPELKPLDLVPGQFDLADDRDPAPSLQGTASTGRVSLDERQRRRVSEDEG